MLKPSHLTPAQKGNLVRFVRRYRARDTGGTMSYTSIGEREFGSPRSLEHLERKGALRVLTVKIGPRGGRERMYVPTPDGLQVADHIVNYGLKTSR